MSRIEIRLLAGFRCDKRDCASQLDLPPERYFHALDLQDHAASEAGWSCWRSRRTEHVYCPEHGPAANTTMRRVW